MAEQVQKISSLISQNIGISLPQVKNTLQLFSEGASIPFISRYRKEKTGSLDEIAVSNLYDEFQRISELIKRKEYILGVIEDQGLLNNSIKSKIDSCWDQESLEDLYLPYKKKKKTKASLARERGLENLAKIIMRQQTQQLRKDAEGFISKELKTPEEALEGARHIIAEWISENKEARDLVRHGFNRSAAIRSKLIAKKKDEAIKYKDYFDFTEPLQKIPSHRLLAIYRGEKEGLLRLKLEIDSPQVLYKLESLFIRPSGSCHNQIRLAIEDSFKRLLFPSIENEFRKAAKHRADEEAISVFANNLQQLLLAPPLGSQNVLAIDPGFRTGCKTVVLDKQGNLVHHCSIFPHPPQNQWQEAKDALIELIDKHEISAVAVGNGTAGKETMKLLSGLNSSVSLFSVNENGASIYSASSVARDEFPNLDLTVRGAISIGRRLMDPLAELVKIDAKSIGVGQYQHDVNQGLLKSQLDRVVERCVNRVGINLNTASKHLLAYVSGIGPVMADNIIKYRDSKGAFQSRKELLNVPRMGKKAFEQSAGFLRIRDAKNPLDDTGVHPERYKLVNKMARDLTIPIASLLRNKEAIRSITLANYISNEVGLPTLKDIISELEKPGLDPRGKAQAFSFAEGINRIEDLKIGMRIPGVVNNLTKFGAFVDLGIKESGLLHISQIANRYIKDPAEVLHLTQKLMVRVIEIDVERKRISLSLKE